MPGKIFFITNRLDHDPLIYKTDKLTVTSDFGPIHEFFQTQPKYIGYDTEFNGPRIYINELLLLQFGNETTQFVVDAGAGIFEKLKPVLNQYFENLLLIGHNLKGDWKLSRIEGIHFNTVFDTMIAEQRINLGIPDAGFALTDVYFRYLKKHMDSDKNERKAFLTMTKKSKFSLGQILYGAEDIPGLIPIAKGQTAVLRQRRQYDWFKENENALLPILGEMELEGVHLDEAHWNTIIAQKKSEKAAISRKLDDHIRANQGNIRPGALSIDMFGNPVIIDGKAVSHISYTSPPQVLKVFKALNLPIPILKEEGKETESIKEASLLQYLLAYPESPLKGFIKDLLDFKECEKFLTSYGYKFLVSEVRKDGKVTPGYKNPFTQKVHTVFKQCETETGRMASGRANEGYFNCQNLPAQEPIRRAFGLTEKEIKDGWYMTTVDLSGAELIIMAALANDMHLYELGADKIIDGIKIEGDLHSPLATKSWRAVYEHRKAKFIKRYGLDTWNTADRGKLDQYFSISDTNNKRYVLTHDFEIVKDKKHPNIQLRTDFKRMGFGVVYGLKPNKGSQTLNIPIDDADIVIKVIEKEIPKTIAMVKQAADYALIDGYVIFNSVSNNRRSFRPVQDALVGMDLPTATARYNYVKQYLDFRTISEIEGAARNCRIQGTQADMIKESKVKCKQFALKHKIEMVPLFSVHDELSIKHKGAEFKSDIVEIMETAANRYLIPYSDTIRMRAEANKGLITNWTK